MNKEELKKNPFFKNQNLDYAYDSLTKVLNREIISSYLHYLIEKKRPFSICLSDIDNFKYINDTYGHIVGDKVLYEFAQKIEHSMGDKCVVGRYGGDEFMIIAENIIEYEEIWDICHRLNKDMVQLQIENFSDLSITVTTGISRFPIDGKTYEDLVGTADKALYRGKTKGRNCFIIYLKEKHANIELMRDTDVAFNSMDMHIKIFDLLTDKNLSLDESVTRVLRYLSTNLMIDHLCLETKKDLFIPTTHALAVKKKFEHIPNDLLVEVLNTSGLFYMNQKKILLQSKNDKLYECLVDQKIESLFLCKIEAYGHYYGILRADMTGKARIWQFSEMDLLVTAAKLIGVLLYHNNKQVEELKKF